MLSCTIICYMCMHTIRSSQPQAKFNTRRNKTVVSVHNISAKAYLYVNK